MSEYLLNVCKYFGGKFNRTPSELRRDPSVHCLFEAMTAAAVVPSASGHCCSRRVVNDECFCYLAPTVIPFAFLLLLTTYGHTNKKIVLGLFSYQKFPNFVKIFHHIKSLNTYIKH